MAPSSTVRAPPAKGKLCLMKGIMVLSCICKYTQGMNSDRNSVQAQGKLYLKKGTVVDVQQPTVCDVVVDDPPQRVSGKWSSARAWAACT